MKWNVILFCAGKHNHLVPFFSISLQLIPCNVKKFQGLCFFLYPFHLSQKLSQAACKGFWKLLNLIKTESVSKSMYILSYSGPVFCMEGLHLPGLMTGSVTFCHL